MLLAPVVKQQKGEHNKLIESFFREGHKRIRVNSEIFTEEEINNIGINKLINAKKKNDIEFVIDRFSSICESDKLRLLESLELTSKFSDGVIYLYDMDKEVIDDIFSTKYACPHCGYSLTVLEPKFFSFNSPAGACSSCDGLGVMEFFDPKK